MSEQDMELTDRIEISFTDGSSTACEVQGIFELDGEEYIALLPEEDEENVYLYGYKEYDDGTYELLDIDDDELFDRVGARYDEVAAEEAELEDEEE